MTKYYFEDLKLATDEYIWLMNESGEGFFGLFKGNYHEKNQTFNFLNHSNGKVELINIASLQRLQREPNTSS